MLSAKILENRVIDGSDRGSFLHSSGYARVTSKNATVNGTMSYQRRQELKRQFIKGYGTSRLMNERFLRGPIERAAGNPVEGTAGGPVEREARGQIRKPAENPIDTVVRRSQMITSPSRATGRK